MAALKAPPSKPVLENYYNVSQAAVRLGLRDKDDPSKKGEKWLRDGVNRKPEDGTPFPCTRMAGQLMFSDSDLFWIAENGRNARSKRTGRKRTWSTRRRSPAMASETPAAEQSADRPAA